MNAEKNRLAKEVVEQWVSFQLALSNKRKYPAGEFNAFATGVRRYVDVIGRDALIHREIAKAVNGLVDSLKVERRRVPDAIIYEASLESLLFSGYDPHFEGDESRVCDPRWANGVEEFSSANVLARSISAIGKHWAGAIFLEMSQ